MISSPELPHYGLCFSSQAFSQTPSSIASSLPVRRGSSSTKQKRRGCEGAGVADLEIVEEVVADERGEAAGAEVRHDGRQARADGEVAGAADELLGERAEPGPRIEGALGVVQPHRLATPAEREAGGERGRRRSARESSKIERGKGADRKSVV